jgi:hypothetical protein
LIIVWNICPPLLNPFQSVTLTSTECRQHGYTLQGLFFNLLETGGGTQ